MKMYLTVQKVVTNNTNVWQDLKAFADVFAKFETSIADIQNTRLIQEGNITGISQDKAQTKEDAISKGLEMSAGVFAYASITTNNTLKQKVDYSTSDLRRSRDTVLIDQLQVIHDAAKEEIAALGDYGIDVDDLTEMLDLISKYEQLVDEPRVAITTRTQATTELADLFSKTDTLLKEQLDKLIIMYKTTEARFYQKYVNARKIINLGIRHEADVEPESVEL